MESYYSLQLRRMTENRSKLADVDFCIHCGGLTVDDPIEVKWDIGHGAIGYWSVFEVGKPGPYTRFSWAPQRTYSFDKKMRATLRYEKCNCGEDKQMSKESEVVNLEAELLASLESRLCEEAHGGFTPKAWEGENLYVLSDGRRFKLQLVEIKDEETDQTESIEPFITDDSLGSFQLVNSE